MYGKKGMNSNLELWYRKKESETNGKYKLLNSSIIISFHTLNYVLSGTKIRKAS